MTPLTRAFDNGHIALVEILLEYRANVNLKLRKCSNTSTNTSTNFVTTMECLVDRVACDSGRSELIAPNKVTIKDGALFHQLNILRVIIQYKADVSGVKGFAPLLLASNMNYP